MSIQLNRNLAITLLFSLAILLALARPSSAIADPPHRRDHVNLNRMIKIRAPSTLIPRQRPPSNPAGSAAPSDGPSSLTPTSTSVLVPLDTSQPSSAPLSLQPSSSLASSVLGSASSSVLSTLSSSSESSTSSTAPTSTATSLTPSTSSPPSTSSTPTPSTQGNKQITAVNGPSVDSVTLTSHVPAPSSSSDKSQIGGSSLSHSAITILIVIAASIVGCGIIWTIIRKWKFRPSAQFEDRLEPVNWQPAEHESGIPTHRRMPSNASSFHSGGHENMGLSRSDSGGGYNAGRSLTPLPDHDFTAGATAVGGYADLARGPSPQPQMQEAMQYGPSVNRGYENYLGPIQGGHSLQGAYDHNDAGARY